MKTILAILKEARGWRPNLYLRLVNPPYITLVIEALDESGPLGLPAISVAHYSEVCGDLLRHPEMQFELECVAGKPEALMPFYWRNDFVAVEQASRYIAEDQYTVLAETYERHTRFAKIWDETLQNQGFAKVFTDKCIVG